MWKVIVVICALGNPCIVFEEDPMRYYSDENKCLEVAFKKHNAMLESFETYGYTVESSEYTCQIVKDVL
tara:strand:- start:75 stop:281 length:207 start_codon:yes stop_codon:yes gene_type:complete